jgi:hypothetical protein
MRGRMADEGALLRMNDQRPNGENRERRRLWQTVRLILLMVCSACVGFVFLSPPLGGSDWLVRKELREQLVITVASAFVGLAIELGLRFGERVKHNGWRFSLRTLLIATTLIAVVLGLVMWSLR